MADIYGTAGEDGRPTHPGAGSKIPKTEISLFWNQVREKPEYFVPNYVVRAYRSLGLQVLPHPICFTLIQLVVSALQNRTPFSVIRIGEGEAKIISWRAYAGMLNLERYTTIAQINIQEDNFHITDVWLSAMRDMMMNSVLEADIVGVRSLTNTVQYVTSIRDLKERTRNNLHGAVGIFRAVDYMLKLAKRNLFRGKVIASAHLYFGILNHLEFLFKHSTKIVCICKDKQVVEKMRIKYPENQFIHIEVGKQNSGYTEPSFLVEIENRIQIELEGVLCLIGAGIWAESYCMWVKRKGGVAIDLGSGFDLWAGKRSRPAHQEFLGETEKTYL